MTDNGYGSLARWLHWLVAPLVVCLVPVGLVMARLDHCSCCTNPSAFSCSV